MDTVIEAFDDELMYLLLHWINETPLEFEFIRANDE